MPALVTSVLRVLRFGAVVGIAAGVIRAIRGTPAPPVTGQASWPSLKAEEGRPTRTGPVQFVAEATNTDGDTEQTWVEPTDGECPESHPIKGNADSMIFHVPGGMSYERTIPERCYASAADAEADGFRQAKR